MGRRLGRCSASNFLRVLMIRRARLTLSIALVQPSPTLAARFQRHSVWPPT